MNEFFQTDDGKKLVKALIGLVGVILIFFIFEIVSLAHSWTTVTPSPNTITVSGTGSATSTPNIATFNFSVSADAKAVADAQSTVTNKVNVALAALKKLGIADKDMTTADYSVYPKYTYASTICPVNSPCPPSRQIPDGYTVFETVSVKVRDVALAGQALGAVGPSASNVSNLSMTLDDPNAPLDSARLQAIDNARVRADALAKRLGVRLGRVISYSDAGMNPGPIYPMYAKAEDASLASAPVLPVGENKTTATVNVTYEIR